MPHKWVAGVGLLVLAGCTNASFAAAPRGKARAGRPEVKRGGMTFASSSVKLTAPDTHPAAYPEAEEAPGHGTLKAKWPQAKSGAPEWLAWNAAVLHETKSVATSSFQGDDAAKTDPDGWSREAIADQESEVTASVEDVSERLVTTKIENDFMLHGGAHPVELWTYLNWLLKDRREVEIRDVFRTDSAWEKAVKAHCISALNRQYATEFPYLWKGDELEKGLSDTVESPRNWKIGARGLTIVFPEYAVAPRMAHPENVTILWADLQPYLAKGFAHP